MRTVEGQFVRKSWEEMLSLVLQSILSVFLGWNLLSVLVIFSWCISLGWLLNCYQNSSLFQGQGARGWHSCLWLGDNIVMLSFLIDFSRSTHIPWSNRHSIDPTFGELDLTIKAFEPTIKELNLMIRVFDQTFIGLTILVGGRWVYYLVDSTNWHIVRIKNSRRRSR